MAEPKTTRTGASVAAFLAAVEDPAQRADAKQVAKLMREATGAKAEMWGPSIVGFGTYTVRYADGTARPWPMVGFSPRKGTLVLYVMSGSSREAALLKQLGPHRTGKSCLYVKRLADVDLDVLRRLVEASVAQTRAREAAVGA
jgi:hypothetical protein